MILVALSTSISPVSAEVITKANHFIVSDTKNDKTKFHNKIDKIKTKQDILELSDKANISETKQEDGLLQYVIKDKEPMETIAYSDGSIDNKFEVVALLASESSETSSNGIIQSFSVSDLPKEEAQTLGNLDVKLKITLIYTERTIVYGNTNLTAIRVDGGKAMLVSFSERYKKYLMVVVDAWGETVNETTGVFTGLLDEDAKAALLNSPVVNSEVAIDVSTTRSKWDFLSWYNKFTSYATITGSIQVSHDGTNYYTYTCSFGIGGDWTWINNR